MSPEVVRTATFVRDAADYILSRGRQALDERGEFRIALSGGNTPRPVYRQLAQAGRDLPSEKLVITFGDERCVPPDDKESNFGMARDEWFKRARVPETSILRMAGEKDPAAAALEYETDLKARAVAGGEPIYRHDLVLLGIGDDGHTASLFPGTTALEEDRRWVVSNFVPKFEAWRLTFTFPLINAARHVCFLVGAGKSPDLIERVLAGDRQYPSARVRPESGNVTWFLEETA